ncbi:MAG: FAD-binding domain-containing protein [Chloroflexota bacterium]
MSQPMRRDFENRDDLITYLQEQFPASVAVSPHITDTKGGRQAAEQRLAEIDPEKYETSRNYLNGKVTLLSPYIRHGILSLAEVRDKAQRHSPVNKLVQELGWRDFFQRIYAEIKTAVWQDQEPYKTGFATDDYQDTLPEDIKQGQTGHSSIDSFIHELKTTGYLHNHARMWLAGYVVHWRRVKWQAGAHWFLQHLLDGDPASNNLSWQWVASTFSHKPYFFNRDNIERFSGQTCCDDASINGRCEFEGSYAQLEKQLFPHKPPQQQNQPRPKKRKRRKRWHQ